MCVCTIKMSNISNLFHRVQHDDAFARIYCLEWICKVLRIGSNFEVNDFSKTSFFLTHLFAPQTFYVTAKNIFLGCIAPYRPRVFAIWAKILREQHNFSDILFFNHPDGTKNSLSHRNSVTLMVSVSGERLGIFFVIPTLANICTASVHGSFCLLSYEPFCIVLLDKVVFGFRGI